MGCFPLYFSLHVTTCHYKGRKAIAFVDNNQQRAINNLNFSFFLLHFLVQLHTCLYGLCDDLARRSVVELLCRIKVKSNATKQESDSLPTLKLRIFQVTAITPWQCCVGGGISKL
jgi:hypothetical protein